MSLFISEYEKIKNQKNYKKLMKNGSYWILHKKNVLYNIIIIYKRRHNIVYNNDKFVMLRSDATAVASR